MSPPPEPLDLRAPWRALQAGLARVLGALLAFPAFKLLWPWPREASLRGDLQPELTGAAIAALATLPMFAIVYALRRTPRPAWALLLVGIGASAWMAASRGPLTDTLELDRWRLLAASCFALALGGAALDSQGRKWLGRASVVVALVALAPALADGEHQFTGVLGNTGSISEAALLGAGVGFALALWDTGGWRWTGAVCAAGYAYYVGLAPVFAGAVSLAAAVGLALVAAARHRKLVAAGALIAALAFGAGRLTPRAPSAPATPGAPVAGASNVGGFEVRRLIWARVPAMLREAGVWGVGPGQFAAAFPPFRDPREIELSSLGRRLPGQETEAHHAHSDYLQVFCDTGVLGGLLFLALATLAAWRSFLALRSGDAASAGLALGLLAVLGNAFLREPLTHNPVSATLAFAALGAVLGSAPRAGATASSAGSSSGSGERAGGAQPRIAEFGVLIAASLALALQVPRAVGIGLHGRALREYFEGAREPERLAFILETRPDSSLARSIAARAIETREGDTPTADTRDAWNEVLALRPHSVEALMQSGLAHARMGYTSEARAQWERALALDPGHPGLSRNLARLEAREGDMEAARAHLARLGVPAERAFRDYAVGALRELDLERGWRLFAQLDARYAALDAERAHHFAREADSALGEAERGALEGSAHVAWAREHAEAGEAAAAVRSYRQARRCLSEPDARGQPSWSRAMRLEYAAALALAGQSDQARAELDGLRASPSELRRVPVWAGQALLDAGLLLR